MVAVTVTAVLRRPNGAVATTVHVDSKRRPFVGTILRDGRGTEWRVASFSFTPIPLDETGHASLLLVGRGQDLGALVEGDRLIEVGAAVSHP